MSVWPAPNLHFADTLLTVDIMLAVDRMQTYDGPVMDVTEYTYGGVPRYSVNETFRVYYGYPANVTLWGEGLVEWHRFGVFPQGMCGDSITDAYGTDGPILLDPIVADTNALVEMTDHHAEFYSPWSQLQQVCYSEYDSATPSNWEFVVDWNITMLNVNVTAMDGLTKLEITYGDMFYHNLTGYGLASWMQLQFVSANESCGAPFTGFRTPFNLSGAPEADGQEATQLVNGEPG